MCAAVWLASIATLHAAPIHLEAPYTLAASGHAPRQVHSGDLNQDGRADLVVTLRTGIAVQLGRGAAHFEPPRVTTLGVVLDAALGDLDRDGRLDAVVTLADNHLVVLQGQGDGGFRITASLPTRVTPRAVHLADVDADGALDAAVACFGERVLSIYRGRGDGGFESPLDRVLEGYPTAIATADFDADGRLDVAVTQRGRSEIWVLLRDGGGLLSGRVVVARLECDPELLASDDFDADGRPDLWAVDAATSTIPILLGGGDGSFAVHEFTPPIPSPIAVAVGDMDADGSVDVAIGNDSDPQLVIGHGDGHGGFQLGNRRDFIAPIGALACVDVSQDGRADLVLVHDTVDRIAVATAHSGGSFGWRVELPIDPEPRDLLAADLDADGDVDLCSSSAGATSLAYFESDGNGSFAPGSIALGSPGGALAASDFDADGGLDLAVASGESRLVTLHRITDGWVPQMTIRVGQEPAAIASGDLDGDQIIDLAVTSTASDRIHVLGGDGTSSFSNLTSPSVIVGPLPSSLAVGELNADGKLDVVTANRGANGISVLLGRGAGAFRSKLDLETGSQPRSVAISDLNGDRRDDLVVANWGSNSLTLIFNDVAGLFQNRRYLSTGRAPLAVRSADLDVDGRNDLVVACDFGVLVFRALAGGFFFAPETYLANFEATGVTVGDVTGEGWPDLLVPGGNGVLGVLPNDGTAHFGNATFLPVGTNPVAVAVAELNGDAKADVAVANSGSNDVSIYLGAGDGRFAAEQRQPVGTGPCNVLPRDLDRDGRVDLVVPNSGSRYASVVHNYGDHFEARPAAPTDLQTAGSAVVDMDADGQEDLVLAHAFEDGFVIILRGQPDGGFEWPGDRPTGPAPHGLVCADLNGDGHLDLASADAGGGTVTVQLADGHGWFMPSRRWAAGREPIALAARDLNHDGRLDLAVADADSDAVAVLIGRGDGEFEAPRFATCGASPVALAIDDLDADGQFDLVTANAATNSISILAGHGDGSFEPGIEYGTGQGPMRVATADLDGDGRSDVVVQNAARRTLAILYNRPAIVPIGIAALAATTGADGVHLEWDLANDLWHQLRGVWVERAPAAAGPWATCNAVALEPRGHMSYLDAEGLEAAASWYRIRLQRADGNGFVSGTIRADRVASAAAVATLEPLALGTGATPTQIRYRLVRASNDVRLEVFDVRGRRVRRLREARLPAGAYVTAWDRTDDQGGTLPRGLFFVRLTVNGSSQVRKLTWIGG